MACILWFGLYISALLYSSLFWTVGFGPFTSGLWRLLVMGCCFWAFLHSTHNVCQQLLVFLDDLFNVWLLQHHYFSFLFLDVPYCFMAKPNASALTALIDFLSFKMVCFSLWQLSQDFMQQMQSSHSQTKSKTFKTIHCLNKHSNTASLGNKKHHTSITGFRISCQYTSRSGKNWNADSSFHLKPKCL